MQEINHFQDIPLSPLLLEALNKLDFTKPTAIQAKAIPLALEGKDILGSAHTGTGKTLAFSLPLLHYLLNNANARGLILTPTRELAQQIFSNINKVLHESQSRAIKVALLVGGEPYNKQLAQLKANARIIIGTPGRIIDLLQQRYLPTAGINYLILDETDRMFEMNFAIQLEQIVRQLPQQRQTLMFSATFPPKVEELAAKYMKQPVRIFVNDSQGMGVQIAPNLVQEVIKVAEENKYTTLLEQLQKAVSSKADPLATCLIFAKTKVGADRLTLRLRKDNYNVCCIHGDLRQSKRFKLMEEFRQGRYQIMVATDIAARGLDVSHILYVINYDLPHTPEDYVHRIGRAARAGAKGFAVSFLSPEDGKRWRAIQIMLNPAEKDKFSQPSFHSKFSPGNNYTKNKPYQKSKPFHSTRNRF